MMSSQLTTLDKAMTQMAARATVVALMESLRNIQPSNAARARAAMVISRAVMGPSLRSSSPAQIGAFSEVFWVGG